MNAWQGKFENVITNMLLLKPDEICTGSWSLLNCFGTEVEATNFYNYIKTQFARALIKAGFPSYMRPGRYYFRFLPLQDFTSNSDINWNTSIAEIDEQLFKKYGLSTEEVSYIKQTIKPYSD